MAVFGIDVADYQSAQLPASPSSVNSQDTEAATSHESIEENLDGDNDSDGAVFFRADSTGGVRPEERQSTPEGAAEDQGKGKTTAEQ